MATTYLRRNPSGNGNQRKFTFSFWIKKNSKNPASTYSLFDCGTSTNYFHIYFPDTHTLTVKSRISNSTAMELVTTRVFRDSAWYNIIVAVDSEQNTAADRCKIYVNGVQETAFNTANYGSQNLDHEIQDAGTYHVIGTNYAAATNETFDGLMSYVAMVDGTQEAPTIFGETDSTTGEWKIKTSITPSVAWGYNGFLILKDGNSVTDQSTNSNNFTVAAGTLTKTEDSPSNVFATLNTLVGDVAGGYTIINGNLSVTANTGDVWRTMYSTLGASTGKYYWEQKITNFTGSNPHYIGISDAGNMKQTNVTDFENTNTEAFGYTKTGQSISKNSLSSYGDSWTTGDIVGVAMDLDNSKLYFSKNGVFQNSGNPANGTNPAYTITSGITYTAATSTYYSNNQYQMNFGNGFFGTTAVASAGSNASGIGIFEYDVPAGYTALSTKGLNL